MTKERSVQGHAPPPPPWEDSVLPSLSYSRNRLLAMANQFSAVVAIDIHRALVRQATGYGVVEFAKCMLEDKGDTLKGKRCLITGSGKVSNTATDADAWSCSQHTVVDSRCRNSWTHVCVRFLP